MKNIHKKILILSTMLLPSLVFSQESPQTATKFRINNATDVDFFDAKSWSEYEAPGTWVAISEDERFVPWESPLYPDTQIKLKMDLSIANINQNFGSAEKVMNVDITGLYMSTINVNADVYITGNFWQDGASTVNINGTSKVVLNDGYGTMNVDTFNITGTDATNRVSYLGNLQIQDGNLRDFTFKNAEVTTRHALRLYSGTYDDGGVVKDRVKNLVIGDNVDFKSEEWFEFEIAENAQGGKSNLILSGNDATATTGNHMSMTLKANSKGDNTIDISGDNSVLSIGSVTSMNIDAGATGSNNIRITGKNSKFINAWDVNIGSAQMTGGLNNIEIRGEGNFFKGGSLFLGNAETMGGSNYVYVGSSNADNMNMTSFYQINLRNSTSENSTVRNTVLIGDNSVVRGWLEGDTSFRINVATDATASGISEVIFKGKNIKTSYTIDINAGNAESTGGTGRIVIGSSDIKYEDQDHLMIQGSINIIGGKNFDKDTNLVGGILEFAADREGFSKFSAERINFTGLLVVDFSNLGGVYVDGARFYLLQYRNGEADAQREQWFEFMQSLADGETSHLTIVTRADDDTVEFGYDSDGNLYVDYYSSVPEPATYAAILGALALGLAVYRRKSVKK